MRLTTFALLMAWSVMPRAEAQPAPLAQRIVGLNITLDLPVDQCTVPAIALALLKDAQIPAGVETLPGRCPLTRPAEITERTALIGMQLSDALNLLVKTDSRYSWIESDGVVVMRPVSAWTNNEHFLNTVFERLELKNDSIGTGFETVLGSFRRRAPAGSQILPGVGNITLSRGPISMLEALDAIVRAHGTARWTVHYCLPELTPDIAMLFLLTYDKRGLGTSVAPPRLDAQGNPITCPPLP